MKPKRNKTDSGISARGQRYWSLMLVGEHGRVIPFRRFKEFAIGVVVVTILSLCALAILGLLYLQQGKTIVALESQIADIKQQNSALKNEKDVLLAKIVINKAPLPVKVESAANKSADVQEQKQEKNEEKKAPASQLEARQAEEKETPVTVESTPAPKVAWKSDIRNISTDYDDKRQILKTQFRIYNVSKPKEPLSGRIVVVYRNNDDPPIKWMAVPHVPLTDGKPVGNKGQAFQVKNFRTMTFRAYQQKYPIPYDTVTVFVFLADGELIHSEDFGFKIAPPPPPPAPEKKEEVPAVNEPVPGTSTQSPTDSEVKERSTGAASTPETQKAPQPETQESTPVTIDAVPMTGGNTGGAAKTQMNVSPSEKATGEQGQPTDKQATGTEKTEPKPEGEKE